MYRDRHSSSLLVLISGWSCAGDEATLPPSQCCQSAGVTGGIDGDCDRALVSLMTACLSGGDVSGDERQRAIDAAMEVYRQEAAAGRDFSTGPCIAEQLDELPDWSVDVAHDPRRDVDNQLENQCQAYRDGETSHFVELDPEGNLIRAE